MTDLDADIEVKREELARAMRELAATQQAAQTLLSHAKAVKEQADADAAAILEDGRERARQALIAAGGIPESAAYFVAVTCSKPRKCGPRQFKSSETADAFEVLKNECEQAGLMDGYPKNAKGEYALITDKAPAT